MTSTLPRTPFLAAYTLPAIHVATLYAGYDWLWVLPIYTFACVPLFDRLAGDWRAEEHEGGPRHRMFDLLLELWLPVQLVVLFLTLRNVAAAPPEGLQWLALALSTGIVTGAGGITIAHELVHRPSPRLRAIGEALLATTLYCHFEVEHVFGHHRRVGTHADPATARLGESLYAFLVRSVCMGAVSAWHIEAQRVAKRRAQGPAQHMPFGLRLAPWSDRRIRYAVVQIGLTAGVFWAGGAAALAAWCAQAFVAVLLLEIVNYVEHYGLARALRSDGRPVRVEPRHSWNSNAGPSSAHLFLLPRHAHHHAEASRPYDQLRALPGGPMLPAGYPAMMLTALVPPLWFRWMDPLARGQA